MTDSPNGALLNPCVEIPFSSFSPAAIEPAVLAAIESARGAIGAIAALPEDTKLTYENSLGALENAGGSLEFAMGVVGHLESVRTTDELRAAYEAVQGPVAAFYAKIPLNGELYRVLKRYAQTDDAKSLDATRARLLEKTLDDFRRHGAELNQEDKARLEALQVELATVTTAFAQSVVDATADYELLIGDESKLAGLPESARMAARASAEQKGLEGWRLTLQAPSLMPALQYLDDAEIRETLWRAYNTRASEDPRDNGARILDILRLRKEKAALLGYDTFADLVLEDRMAGSGAKARDFVGDLRERSEAQFRVEQQALTDFRRELEGADAPGISPWDVGYYSEKLRRARFDFDEEALRPYFVLEDALQGMFDLVERLYGVNVTPIELESWHPQARTYAIDDASGHRFGVFHADLHPREDKRGGAWMNALVTGSAEGDEPLSPHVGLICGNLTEPLEDRPALLTHRELETLFHEFGHLLHHMLTRVPVRSLAGTNVAWDFVELPSQIMENWCWERECLDSFAKHYETGEKIPDALFEKLQRTRTFRAASAMMRQLSFADVDMALHVDYDPTRDGELLSYARARMSAFAPAPLPDNYAMICGFNHLFSSPVAYAAGYYSYKWAEVLDADAFSAFKEGGIFSREVGERFLETLLSQGDSRDPMALFVDFMGRQPRLEALLERSGLVQGSAA